MRKLSVYNFLSLNGYYKDANNGIDWHHHEQGGEEEQFSDNNLKHENALLFGRVTYEMMAGFWPTPMAAEMYPGTAKGMNKAKKYVVSNTLQQADWANTTIINTDLITAVRQLKETSDRDITILGSGSLVSQLTDAGLIDGYQIMIDPVALKAGTPIFHNVQNDVELKLTGSRVFESGIVLLEYAPA
jgi:dihydrofolate reductase